jgi:hypothetical protein
VGIDDIQAGRFKTFDAMASLRAHNKSLTAKRLAEAQFSQIKRSAPKAKGA